MVFKAFLITLLLSAGLFAQEFDQRIADMEKAAHSNLITLSKVNYPGESKIDVTYYGLDLSVTYSPRNINGSVTINAKVDTTSIDNFFLDLQDVLTVTQVLLNGSATTYTHSNDELHIDLDRTYNQGEEFSVEVFYNGIPGSSGFGSFEFGTHNGNPVIWTLSEPYGTSDWFPCKDTPADKADSSDVWITVVESIIPVSNGTLENITVNGDGTHTYYWKNHHPIAQYLISLAMTNYHQYDTYYHYSPTDSMVITHYTYPETFNGIKTLLDETDDMIAVFSEKYGMYPFVDERYGHAEMQWGGAMEHQTCSSMGFWGRGVISHELAHQWYGDMITCKDWHHIWLNEGFATYSEGVYLEDKFGQNSYNQFIVGEMNSARNANGTIWVQNINSIGEIFNGARTYAKGSIVLHMLRGVVGDSTTFFNIMRAYSSDPILKYGVATTEDFQAVAESVYGQPLDYFFQEWIYGENYPVYNVWWSYVYVSGQTYRMYLNITQDVNSNPSYFTMPVQIKINTVLGDTVVTVFNNAQNQDFQFDVVGRPLSIVFDPDNWILKIVDSILPVELVSFTGRSENGNIILEWTTATEINNLGFEIQRSLDNNQFNTIGFVEGNGTSTERNEYSFVDEGFQGKIYYRLKQIDFNGTFSYSDVIEINGVTVTTIELEQNYPNPFNPSTKIKYQIADAGFVNLRVYDVLGNEVSTLINKDMQAGSYEVEFNASNLPSGIYYYTLNTGSYSQTKKMILLK
jgi:Peptidase family M1 domain/Peptidase M1 N-terminal domain/Secretion system C-terminal sorting domain